MKAIFMVNERMPNVPTENNDSGQWIEKKGLGKVTYFIGRTPASHHPPREIDQCRDRQLVYGVP
jgi:hypothetical protein